MGYKKSYTTMIRVDVDFKDFRRFMKRRNKNIKTDAQIVKELQKNYKERMKNGCL